MIEYETINHHIERQIIGYLHTHEFARFSDMRPKSVETNLFTYHLKLLLAASYIQKTAQGYTLGPRGLLYVDRTSSSDMRLRTQPKIITMLLVQDGYGKVLLQKRHKQPHINSWTLPGGKLHIDDMSVKSAGIREAQEKLGITPKTLRHVGDCYIILRQSETQVENQTRTLVHVLRFETDEVPASDSLTWTKPLQLVRLPLAPGIEPIITRAFFNDPFFFEEFYITIGGA